MADSLDQALRTIAGQNSSGSGAFTVPCGERNINVSFTTNQDDEILSMSLSCGYDLVARPAPTYRENAVLRAPRPLAIILSHESASEVEAKKQGLVVEWQSQDPAFDQAVFVNSPVRDSQVLAAVLGSSTRRAVLALFGLGFSTVEIDVNGVVQASIGARCLEASPVDERVKRTLAAFNELLSALPTIEATGTTNTRPPLFVLTSVLALVGLMGWLLNVGYAGIVLMVLKAFRPDLPVPGVVASLGCVLAGLLGGVLGAVVYGALVERLVRGRSDALMVLGRAKISAFGGFSVLVFTATLATVLLSMRLSKNACGQPGFNPALGQGGAHPRGRTSSAMVMLAATATLSDPTAPDPGMVIIASHWARIRSLMPSRS